MEYRELKPLVKDLADHVCETPIKDGQPYNTRTIGWKLEVTTEGETFTYTAGSLEECYRLAYLQIWYANCFQD